LGSNVEVTEIFQLNHVVPIGREAITVQFGVKSGCGLMRFLGVKPAVVVW